MWCPSGTANQKERNKFMKLVFLIGDAAVGKMTVGQELMKLTGLRLFHNHMTIEPVIEIFGAYNANVTLQPREVIFREFAKSDNKGMIFTYLWAFDMQSDWDYIAHVADIFRQQGTVADARRHHDHIPFLQPVALRAHQIFHVAGILAAEDLAEIVGMEAHLGVGNGNILVGIHIAGGHFQLLVKSARLKTDGFQMRLNPLLASQNILFFNFCG